uniref:Elongation of very long chain fatty acids protein n=1 Tax=Salmo trutta TaxID=8032 RepID=A0A674DBY9_SALTR
MLLTYPPVKLLVSITFSFDLMYILYVSLHKTLSYLTSQSYTPMKWYVYKPVVLKTYCIGIVSQTQIKPRPRLKSVLNCESHCDVDVVFWLQLICASWSGGYRLQCQGLHEAGEADVRVAKVLWWYYFSKLIEFLDTMFFVLRKKNSHITFLHVYHHASMFNIWWSVLNWIPCGQSLFGPTLNSFIHVCMYSYYGLSTIPSMQKYLWWKHYLTQAQLVQFLLSIIHTLVRCLLFQVSYMATLVILFVNFYIQTYRKTAQRRR